MSDKRIVIFGAGAAGSYLGAYMTREGHDVTLLDMWGEHVETMRESGLRASGTQDDFTVPVNAHHLSDAMQIEGEFDIGFLAMKSYDTEWSAHFLKRLVKNDGVVVSSQNCMNDRLVASIVGYERAVGCIMSSITVALWEPGHVTRGGPPGRGRGHVVFRVGELHGRVTPRVEELAEILMCVDDAKATSNLWGERWSKLTTNSSGNPVGAMTGLGAEGVASTPDARRIQINICKESCQVALAQNYQVEPIRGVSAETYANADDGEVFEELDAQVPALRQRHGLEVVHGPGRAEGAADGDRVHERLHRGRGAARGRSDAGERGYRGGSPGGAVGTALSRPGERRRGAEAGGNGVADVRVRPSPRRLANGR